MPLRVQNVSSPFDLHSAAVSDSHLPCRAHAMLWPCLSSQGHGTARPSRDGLWVPARVRLLPATTRSSTKIDIRSIPILLTMIHTYDCKEWYQHTTKMMIGYFRLQRGLSRRTWHSRSRAGARHGHGMQCVNPP